MIRGSLVVPLAIAVAVGATAFALLVQGGGDGPGAEAPGEFRSTDVGWSDEGRRAFAAMGCGSCHRLAAAGSTGAMAPSLDTALAGHDRESLRHAIVRPPTGMMPADYGERMTDAELDALVSFLLASR